MRKTPWVATGIAAVALAAWSPFVRVEARQISSQSSQTTAPSSQSPSSSSRPSLLDREAPDPLKDRMEEQASRNRNSERHKRIVADAEKLLALSTELKADVDKTTKNEMSVEVIKKAADIEKLAHDVKERMKGP